MNRISRIYSRVYIDEVQDLAGYDLEIIKLLFESKSHVLLIGDPRQVTYFTHYEAKNIQYNGKISVFIHNECGNSQYEIDTESLNETYRNIPAICSFSEKLFPEYGSIKSSQSKTTEHDGIYLINTQQVNDYLKYFQPVQLRWNNCKKVNLEYPVYNMGESKGMEFDRVIIYPTKPIIDWLENNTSNLQPEARAKFYVAVTRAKYSVAIVCDPNFRCDDPTIQVWSHD